MSTLPQQLTEDLTTMICAGRRLLRDADDLWREKYHSHPREDVRARFRQLRAASENKPESTNTTQKESAMSVLRILIERSRNGGLTEAQHELLASKLTKIDADDLLALVDEDGACTSRECDQLVPKAPVAKREDKNWQLTNRQIERQEFVEGAILALLDEVAGRELEEEDVRDLFGEIRDVISAEFAKLGVMSEMDFYPFCEQ